MNLILLISSMFMFFLGMNTNNKEIEPQRDGIIIHDRQILIEIFSVVIFMFAIFSIDEAY